MFLWQYQCINVNILLRRYFKYLGIEATVIYGTLLNSVPHVFLEVGGSFTDNTYSWHDESKNYKDNGKRFYNIKSQLSRSDYSKVPLDKAEIVRKAAQLLDNDDDRRFGSGVFEVETE